MVYHIELWFIYGLSMVYHLKNHPRQPLPLPMRSSLLAPLNITFGQSDAFTWPPTRWDRAGGTALQWWSLTQEHVVNHIFI